MLPVLGRRGKKNQSNQPLPAPYKRPVHDVNETDKRTPHRPTKLE